MWRPEDLATVGELLLDISANLVQTYGLTFEEIEKSLPLIDTSKTLIREVCPAFLSNVECRAGKYRRNDGLCTNLQNPTWGATLAPFQRVLSPRFADGLTAPRISVTSHDLPLSRIVSRTMHPDEGYHDHAGTVMVIAWGQFMDHDYTLTGTPLDPLNRNDPEECCHRPPHLKNPYCNEILIPEDDYFYRLFNVKCMDFVRAFPAVRPGCRLGSRVPFNLLTGVLDGNTVYGITESFARKLRAGYGGLLRMNPVFSEYGLKDLLPLKLDIPDEGCTRPNRSMYCFEAGEIRVNEQLVLTCMHTLMAREHNRIAKTLIQINPHWDDETLYQEARRIVIAEIQHITYNEFLPILLGKDVMEKFGLLLEKNSYWDGYDESVNPSVIDAFASAAFRFGHSLLPTAVERWSKAHKFIASKRLSDLIRRPFDLYRAGVFDEYIMGLMNQVAQAMDDSITQEVTNHLFKKVGAKFGLDLVSFNMQRGREFGIPSYMEFRKFCGLPWVDTFDELHGSMPNETIRRYSSIFEHPADVDLWSGGVSERPLPGSMLGPTFACIIATQFSYSRRGDRFWYELPNQPSSFTLDQLNEIRKIKLARVICDNTDLIDTIQIYPMVLPDHEINPRVPCRSGVLPSMDLTKWAEFPTANHAQYAKTRRIESLLAARSVMKKPSKKIDKKVEKDVSNNSSTNFSNRNLVLLESTFLKSGRNNGKNKIEVANALNNYRRKTMVKRSKRSLDKKKSNYFEEKVPLSKRLYRHPKLSYEEQKNHSFQDTFDSLQSKTTMKPLLKESNKHTYVSSNEYFEMQKSLENTKDDKNMLNEAIKDTNTSQSLVKRQNRRNYINIQDHQKTVNNGTSADILEYDPNKIPYVEVPDYSDIREESLDEKDRRMKEEKNDDFIDPEISTNSEEDSWKGSRRDSIKENDTNFTNFKTYTDIKRLNNNNNNNNNDDNNKPDNLKKPERSNDFKDSCERLKSDKFEGSKGGGLLKNSNELRSNEDNLNNSNVDKGAGENSEENHGPPTEDPGETREDTGSRSGPIIFDINEYRKPFDLDEFLKDDPIMKKLKLLEKETRANYGQNGKRVSADESESDNAFREQANGQRNCAEVQHTFDHLPKSRESSKVFAKVDEKKDEEKDGTRSEKINNREDSNEENEHFLRFVFEKRDDRLPGFENEEKSRYFVSGDAIRNLEGDIGKDRKRKDRSRKEDVYEALSAILGEKSRVSRLDEAERIGDEPALEYKNFWSLEYKSPRVDMEAQERRK